MLQVWGSKCGYAGVPAHLLLLHPFPSTCCSCSSDGLCECAADWAGGDCSVPLNTTSCLPGSQRALDRPDQHGTCWQECRCAGNGTDCAFSDSCAGFSCQEGWRRRATQDECVQDECVKVREGGREGGAWRCQAVVAR